MYRCNVVHVGDGMNTNPLFVDPGSPRPDRLKSKLLELCSELLGSVSLLSESLLNGQINEVQKAGNHLVNGTKTLSTEIERYCGNIEDPHLPNLFNNLRSKVILCCNRIKKLLENPFDTLLQQNIRQDTRLLISALNSVMFHLGLGSRLRGVSVSEKLSLERKMNQAAIDAISDLILLELLINEASNTDETSPRELQLAKPDLCVNSLNKTLTNFTTTAKELMVPGIPMSEPSCFVPKLQTSLIAFVGVGITLNDITELEESLMQVHELTLLSESKISRSFRSFRLH